MQGIPIPSSYRSKRAIVWFAVVLVFFVMLSISELENNNYLLAGLYLILGIIFVIIFIKAGFTKNMSPEGTERNKQYTIMII